MKTEDPAESLSLDKLSLEPSKAEEIDPGYAAALAGEQGGLLDVLRLSAVVLFEDHLYFCLYDLRI